MKAMVLERLNEPLVYRDDFPKPEVQNPHDVIIKVLSCGLCTTDVKVQRGIVDPERLPRILGHEVAGVVVEVGADVTKVQPGDRIISATYQSCRTCESCRKGRDTLCRDVNGRIGITVDGGFAEYMRLQDSCAIKIPDGLDEAKACLFPCGGGVPYHALIRQAKIKPSDQVLLMGTGGIGIQAVQLCKSCGATVVALDMVEAKLNAALAEGADYAINTKDADFLDQLAAVGGGTVVLDTIGEAELMNAVVTVLQPGARIALVGYGPGHELHIDTQSIILKEIEIYGSRGVGVQDVADMMDLLERGTVSPVITRYPLEQLNEVIEKLNNNELIGKAVIVP